MKARLRVVTIALWWGSLSGLAFVVVPLLFKHLANPAAAGAMAAKLFSAQTWISVGCGLFLLLTFIKKDAATHIERAPLAIKFIVAGMLFALLVEFAVAPRIVTARGVGGDLKLWHALGTGFFVAQWLCAGWSLWRLAQTPPDAPPVADLTQ